MSEALIEHLRDLFAPLGPISARAMFGGHGVYFDGMMIGVIIEDAFYLKTDADTRGRFEAVGCQPCIYRKKGKPMPMSYWSLPAEAMDSPQALRPWVLLAVEAARRKPAGKPRRRSR